MPLRYYLIIALLLVVWPFSPAQAAPEPPSSITATAVPNVARITITWEASPTSGVFYRLYRSSSTNSNRVVLADDLNTLAYTDETVVYHITYYYRVAAVLSGVESPLSAATASARPALPWPVNVKATDTKLGRQIKITWDRPTLDIALKYHVFRSTSEGNLGGAIATNLDVTEYSDKDVSNGTYYYYRVKSVYNSNIESDASAVAGVSPTDATPPDRPSEVRSEAQSNNKARVSWRGPNNETNPRYRVFRSSSPSGAGAQITETDATSYTDTLPPGLGTYYYRVSAIDASGNESLPSDATRVDMSSPATTTVQQYKVSELRAGGTLNRGEVQLNWKLPDNADISYSRIYRRLADVEGASPAMIADKVYGNSYLDKTAQGGKRYYYSISLVNKNGSVYESSGEVSGASFTEKSIGSTVNNGKTTANPTQPVASNQTSKKLIDVKNRTYAYGRPRMTNLKLEAALTNGLRRSLVKKLGAKKVPAKLNPVLIRAYIYGGYVIDEIADTIINGTGLVHPTIRAVEWRRSAEYQKNKKK